jgi:hypothetical protein
MPSLVLRNAYLSVNAVNLSARVRQVTVNYSAEIPDKTAMSNTSRARLGGLKDWSLDVEFLQDFDAGQVDATIFPIVGTQIAIEVRPDAGAVSATNPKYTGNGIIESYSPIAGAVGDTAMTPVRIVGADGVALARATA